MIFSLDFLQSHAQHDAGRGGTVVVHLPSFILEDEMRETFRGLMEVSRFREILSTAERQMNFNRIIEWDKLFACFLQKWWNDKGLAGSCCLYIWSVGTTQISVQLGASCPTEEFWPRCWSGQPVHEHLSVSRTNLCRMSPSVPCWACRWCLSHPLSESLNKFSWIFLDTKRRLRRPDKICNSRCRLWERLANKDGNTQINQQINMKPR